MPLPFKTAPKVVTQVVGDPEIGELVFPVYGALLSGERIAIDEVDYESVLLEQSARLAVRVQDAYSLSEEDANLAAVRILSGQLGLTVQLSDLERRIRLRDASLIREIENTLNTASQRHTLRTVTAAILYRLKTDGWSDADTEREVPEPLRNAIHAFMLQEQAAGKAPQDPAKVLQDLADMLGKFVPAESGPPSTGPSGSGSSAGSGPTTPPATSTASGSRRRRTSKKPSPPAAA